MGIVEYNINDGVFYVDKAIVFYGALYQIAQIIKHMVQRQRFCDQFVSFFTEENRVCASIPFFM